MKIKTILWSALLGISLTCCEDNDTKRTTLDKLDPRIRDFITMRLSSNSAMQMSGDAAVNRSYQSLMAEVNNFGGGRSAGDSTDGTEPDTVIYENPWVSCAVITQTENEDGSITYTYDYGDGCEEGWGDYKYIMRGKYSYTYKFQYGKIGSLFTYFYDYSFEYDNYGGISYYDSIGWFTDGFSSGTGHSSYDTATHKFSGNYSNDSDMQYRYGDQEQHYQSTGEASYDENGGTVTVNDYEYGDGENFYRSTATRPLISDYTCNSRESLERYIWVYVSGTETITYQQDGESGSFEIDYGNGECDNIIVIIENGERTEVDLGDLIFFCGTEPGFDI